MNFEYVCLHIVLYSHKRIKFLQKIKRHRLLPELLFSLSRFLSILDSTIQKASYPEVRLTDLKLTEICWDFTACDTKSFPNSLRDPPVMELAPPAFILFPHVSTSVSTLQQNSRKLFHIYTFSFFWCVLFLGLCAGRILHFPPAAQF